MSENYIVINGKRAELTEEQLKALGIELKEPSPFEEGGECDEYYFITSYGSILKSSQGNDMSGSRHAVANYCTDHDLLLQQAYRETLNRLLWRFSMENGGKDINWMNDERKFMVVYSHDAMKWIVDWSKTWQRFGIVNFINENIARQAIKEIVEPFMKAHPDFKL